MSDARGLDGRAAAHCNRAAAENDRGNFEAALECARQAIEIDPALPEAHNNLGIAQQALGDPEQAVESFRRALRFAPTLHPARINLAFAELLLGRYESGFAGLEARLEPAALPSAYAGLGALLKDLDGLPRWQGEPLARHALLVWTDQGLGDSIMMLRYLPLLKTRGAAELIVRCERALARLAAIVRGVDRVVPREEPPPVLDFDLHCPIMSLPYRFATRLESIPRQVPYLSVPVDLAAQWRARLSGTARPRVGLAWAGGAAMAKARSRDIPLDMIEPLLAIPGVRFLNLQKDRPPAAPMANWMPECGDLLETAALLEQLDLVISVDTAVAHLAGALGRPVWLLNRADTDWRWMPGREDSAWYPTMRIFTQSRRGDWSEVIARVCAALAGVATR